MRWLLRMLLFWAISLPLFYVFGLPKLLDYLNTKTRGESYTQCITQLTNEGMLGNAHSPMNQAQGEGYCHCVSDTLTFTQDDILDIVQKKEPAALTAQSKAQVAKCNTTMQQQLNAAPPAVPVPAPAATQPPAAAPVQDGLGVAN